MVQNAKLENLFRHYLFKQVLSKPCSPYFGIELGIWIWPTVFASGKFCLAVNWDALCANMDILKTGLGKMSIFNLNAISLIPRYVILEEWVTFIQFYPTPHKMFIFQSIKILVLLLSESICSCTLCFNTSFFLSKLAKKFCINPSGSVIYCSGSQPLVSHFCVYFVTWSCYGQQSIKLRRITRPGFATQK